MVNGTVQCNVINSTAKGSDTINNTDQIDVIGYHSLNNNIDQIRHIDNAANTTHVEQCIHSKAITSTKRGGTTNSIVKGAALFNRLAQIDYVDYHSMFNHKYKNKHMGIH